MKLRSRKIWGFGLFLLVLWAQLPALHARFQFIEDSGILENPDLQSLSAFLHRLGTLRGWRLSPITHLTFAMNLWTSKDNPVFFHGFNLLIHLLNGVLLMRWARKLKLDPLLSGALFLLHPLSSAVCGQAFGRGPLLGTFFSLGLWNSITRNRTHDSDAQPVGWRQALLAASAILSKASFVVVPVLLAGKSLAKSPRQRRRPWIPWLTVGGISGIYAAFYLNPLIRTAPVGWLTALASQLGNFEKLARSLVLPFETAFYHDLPFYDSFLNLRVLIGLGLAGTLATLLWIHRKSPHIFIYAAFFLFMASTNSLIPRGEVLREWRLYPSVPYLCLIAALAYKKAAPVFRRAMLIVFMALGLADALSLRLQYEIYRDPLATWAQVADHYPELPEAWYNQGVIEVRRENPGRARAFLEKAALLNPQDPRIFRGLGDFCRDVGDRNCEDRAHRHLKQLEQNGIHPLNRFSVRKIDKQGRSRRF